MVNLCALRPLRPLRRHSLISFRLWLSSKVGANRPMLVLATPRNPRVIRKSKERWTGRQEINVLDPPWSLPLWRGQLLQSLWPLGSPSVKLRIRVDQGFQLFKQWNSFLKWSLLRRPVYKADKSVELFWMNVAEEECRTSLHAPSSSWDTFLEPLWPCGTHLESHLNRNSCNPLENKT